MTPSWWQFLLLAAAAYRVWRLISEDTVFDAPRKWVLGLPRTFDPELHDPQRFYGYRERLAVFLTCPWCCGFWVAVLWWISWLASDKWATAAAVPFALSAAVGITAKHLE